MKKLSIINENIFDGIGRRSKGGVIRKEDEIRQVNLGLPSGTIWAACNLGAESPEEYGDYYAWGETEPKDKYTWNTYKFGTKNNLTKYNRKDGKTILDPEDDAAHVVLGGKWHIPTKDQIQELIDNTTNEQIELDGKYGKIYGKLFTSKINKEELFFPFSGRQNDIFIDGEYAWNCCWSSSLLTDYSCAMTFLCVEDNDDLDEYGGEIIYPNPPEIDNDDRYYGLSVRGVWNK